MPENGLEIGERTALGLFDGKEIRHWVARFERNNPLQSLFLYSK
jgi:hypothetical protein